jgi:hypothetical protein
MSSQLSVQWNWFCNSSTKKKAKRFNVILQHLVQLSSISFRFVSYPTEGGVQIKCHTFNLCEWVIGIQRPCENVEVCECKKQKIWKKKTLGNSKKRVSMLKRSDGRIHSLIEWSLMLVKGNNKFGYIHITGRLFEFFAQQPHILEPKIIIPRILWITTLLLQYFSISGQSTLPIENRIHSVTKFDNFRDQKRWISICNEL